MMEMTEEQVLAMQMLAESCGKMKTIQKLKNDIKSKGQESDLKKRAVTYLLKKMEEKENGEVKEFLARVKTAIHIYSVDPADRGRYLQYVVSMAEMAIPDYDY